MTMAVVNARSVSAKIGSLIDMFCDLDLFFACISETWLKDNDTLYSNIADLEEAHGITMITRSRRARGGGVAIAYKKDKMKLKRVSPISNHEILCVVGNSVINKATIVVISYYIPPNYEADQVSSLFEEIGDIVSKMKSEHDSPMIYICGDANRKKIETAYEDYDDIRNVTVCPSRGDALLLQGATNQHEHLKEHFTVSALTDEAGTESDHRALVFSFDIPRRDSFTKRVISFRSYTDKNLKKFGTLLEAQNWDTIRTGDPSSSVEEMTKILDTLVEQCFPLKTKTIKSGGLPWANAVFLRKRRQRMRCFKMEGRSPRWKQLKKETQRILREQKILHLEKVLRTVKGSRSTKGFFDAVKLLRSRDPPKSWKPQDMFPDLPDGEIAEHIAAYFNRISQEYTPIPPPLPPTEQHRKLEAHQIAGKLKAMKKPKGCLRGDISPKLNNAFADLIALPLEYVFNLIRETASWPQLWKQEQVTVIPKSSCPDSLSQLRNLSCTPLYSKLLETFVLEDLKSEINLSPAQFGGQKGCGVDHFLVETWDRILSDLEDNRAAVNLVSIDFEKAFNRMDHHVCIAELVRKGASPSTVSIVSAFLHGRSMVVRIGESKSVPRPAPGGSPQGSILANTLFCVVADSLADDATSGLDIGMPGPPPARLPPIGAETRTSTPIRRTIPSSPSDESTGDNTDNDESFRFFRLRRPYRIESSDEESFMMQQNEIDEILGVPERWIRGELEVKSYIDDFSCIEKIRAHDSIFHVGQGKRKVLAHAPQSQCALYDVRRAAGEKHMKVNAQKTQMLCIYANYDDVRSYISTDGKRLVSGDTLKILGFTFGRRPDCRAHLDCLLPKLRRRLWVLYNLKFSGMLPGDMLFVYKAVIRPVADFAAPAYHTLLTQGQSDCLERIQRRAFKIIFGNDVSYATVLREMNITSLKERREELVRRFASKAARNPRFCEKWFPKHYDTGHNTRRPKRYREFLPRTNRLAKSPLFVMRRMLNENENNENENNVN